MRRVGIGAMLLAGVLAACGNGGSSPADAAPDPSPDLAPTDPGADLPPGDDGSWLDPHGFRIRVPLPRTIPIEGPGGQTGTTQASDLDWVCTLKYDDVDGFLYLQLRPLKDRGWVLGGITYQADGAWVSVGGTVTPVEASYDVGGNHRNDWILLAWAGSSVRYYHSSMGRSWRKCQPPDCLQISAGDGTGPILQDGCTPERTLPVVCVNVQPDGTVPPLVDTFQKCPGDPGR